MPHAGPGAGVDTLLDVRNLCKSFASQAGTVHAVRDVSFRIARGQTLGLVGESGSGKSTTGRCVLHLTPPTSGEVVMGGQPLGGLGRADLRRFRTRMQMIFQDPYASLNPRMSILECVREPLKIHRRGTTPEQLSRAAELLDLVGIAQRDVDKSPGRFSGGQLQRVGIARAVALQPDLIVCDEPVSALDVSIQAQVLNLLKDLQDEFALTYLFISHDLAVIRDMCDQVCVMRGGSIVESGATGDVLAAPQQEYTQELVSAAVRLDKEA